MKKISKSCIYGLICFFIALIVLGCNIKPDGDKPNLPGVDAIVSSRPTVISTFPEDGSTEIDTNTSIIINFSRAMNPVTITTNTTNSGCSGSVQLSSDSFTTCIQMVATPSSNGSNEIFTFSPILKLSADTTFKIKITALATDTYSRPLENAYISKTGFTTESAGQSVAGRLIEVLYQSLIENGFNDDDQQTIIDGTVQSVDQSGLNQSENIFEVIPEVIKGAFSSVFNLVTTAQKIKAIEVITASVTKSLHGITLSSSIVRGTASGIDNRSAKNNQGRAPAQLSTENYVHIFKSITSTSISYLNTTGIPQTDLADCIKSILTSITGNLSNAGINNSDILEVTESITYDAVVAIEDSGIEAMNINDGLKSIVSGVLIGLSETGLNSSEIADSADEIVANAIIALENTDIDNQEIDTVIAEILSGVESGMDEAGVALDDQTTVWDAIENAAIDAESDLRNNERPVVTDQSLIIEEDTVLSIDITGTDSEGEQLVYTITHGPDNGVLSGSPPILTYTPNDNFVGNDNFRFKADDGQLDSTVATCSITVTAINDVPVAIAESIALNENSSVSTTLTGFDVEGSSLSFTVVTHPINGTLTGVAPNLTYIPNSDYSGPDEFTFKVNDGQADSPVSTVSIFVNSVHDCPIISGIPESSVESDSNYQFAPLLTNVEPGSILVFSITNQPAWTTFNSATGELSGTPQENEAGTYGDIRISVSDGICSLALGSFNILVIDTVSPAEVTNLTATPGPATIVLSWQNPATSDFQGVKIVRKIGSYPSSASDGNQVYDGNRETVNDTDLVNETLYYYKLFTYDDAFNYSIGTGISAAPVESDIIAPTNTSILINEGDDSTTSILLSLSLSATDNEGIVAYFVSSSNTEPNPASDGWTSIAPATSYSDTVSFNLEGATGIISIYAWFKDAAGNVSNPTFDTINVISNDASPPMNPSVLINNGSSFTSSTAVILQLSADDDTGITAYYASESDTTPVASDSDWVPVSSTTNYSAAVSFTLSAGNATKTVIVWFKDASNNVSGSSSDSIVFSSSDLLAPVNASIIIDNNEELTESLLVDLTISASDDTGVIGYYISESSSVPLGSSSGWSIVSSATEFSAIVPYTLSSDGIATVYVWFKDAGGNVSENANSSITCIINETPLPDSILLPDSGQVSCHADVFGEDSDYAHTPSSYTDNGDGTISDNVTGLMWMKEANNDSCRFQSTICLDLNLAGYSDWRLPNPKELVSLANYGVYLPTIDIHFFEGRTYPGFWTSAADAGNPDNTWVLNFYYGDLMVAGKNEYNLVRCVRGMSSDVIWVSDFIDRDDGTIEHPATELMWQKEDDNTIRKWGDAISYCESLSLGNFSDWYLPNIKELQTIVSYDRLDPAVNTTFFTNPKSTRYWSSTSVIYTDSGDTSAWTVDFNDGTVRGTTQKSYRYYSRCVRKTGSVPIDTTAPHSGSVLINHDAIVTSSATVTLTLSAVDDTGVFAYYASESDTMPSKCDNGWIRVAAVSNYSEDVSFRLADGDGLKTVYVFFRDYAGNVSAAESSSITLSYAQVPIPDTGQIKSYEDDTEGEDHDYAINPLEYTENQDGTVTDVVTGLSWQKEDDGILRTWDNAMAYCDQSSLAGYDDWRLPNSKELQSIVNYGTNSPAIDQERFPNTKQWQYWSSSHCAFSPSWPTEPLKWVVNFQEGEVIYEEINNSSYVRCVRGFSHPVIWSLENVDSGSGVVTQLRTNLMWQNGMINTQTTWSGAIGYCEGLSHGGFDDWRLPNVKELYSIVDQEKGLFVYDTEAYTDMVRDEYWTSTTVDDSPDLAWRVGFDYGFVTAYTMIIDGEVFGDKDSPFYARCVRGGIQLPDTRPPKNTSISINGGDETTTSNYLLFNLAATDDHGVTAYYISLSDTTPDVSDSDWVSVDPAFDYSADIPYTARVAEGTLTIYVWFKDAANHISLPASDSIMFDAADTPVPDTGQTFSTTGFFGEDSDYLINSPSYTDSSNDTILDNITGLVWQKKDDGIARQFEDAVSYCSDLTFGIYDDWRLPNPKELQFILDNNSYSPIIDQTFFPDTQELFYWTSTPYAQSTSTITHHWIVSFMDGRIIGGYYIEYHFVRCVRGNNDKLSWPLMFSDHENEMITHPNTGLIWQKSDDGIEKTWLDALTHCEELSQGGHDDWRLPNLNELHSITDYSRFRPAIDQNFFEINSNENGRYIYWSSTSYIHSTHNDDARYVDFYSGILQSSSKNDSYYVRCVRSNSD